MTIVKTSKTPIQIKIFRHYIIFPQYNPLKSKSGHIIDRFTKGRITAPRPDLRLELICAAQHRYSNTLTMIHSSRNWEIKNISACNGCQEMFEGWTSVSLAWQIPVSVGLRVWTFTSCPFCIFIFVELLFCAKFYVVGKKNLKPECCGVSSNIKNYQFLTWASYIVARGVAYVNRSGKTAPCLSLRNGFLFRVVMIRWRMLQVHTRKRSCT